MSLQKRLDELNRQLRPMEELSTSRTENGTSELQQALAEFLTSGGPGATYEEKDAAYAESVARSIAAAKQAAIDETAGKV